MPEREIPPLPSRTRDAAKDLRSTMPDAERELWLHLRAARLNGFKFRRQHSVPPYIVDFVCMHAMVIVEVDGSQHAGDVDVKRDSYLRGLGFEVLRFWNNDVLGHTVVVLEVILRAVQSRTLSPTPLPRGEGLRSLQE